MFPEFGPDGLLPAGVHWATWQEFIDRFGGNPRRQKLLEGLAAALEALEIAGCEAVYINGTFVTAKPDPADYDGCWEVAGVDSHLLDPVLLDFADGRAAQKEKYGGELFPAQLPEGVSGRTFLEFFQIDRESGRPKGIVALDLREW